MSRWVEKTTIAVGYLVAAILFVGGTGIRLPEVRQKEPGVRPAAYFHGGKTARGQVPDTDCQSRGCHEAYPHEKDRTESVFRNMHQNSMDCLACHGREAEKRWVGEQRPDRKGLKLGTSRKDSKGNPHVELGQAASCRKCHSEKGRELLREKGMHDLPPGYADPIVLRMIEGGPKRWAPAVR